MKNELVREIQRKFLLKNSSIVPTLESDGVKFKKLHEAKLFKFVSQNSNAIFYKKNDNFNAIKTDFNLIERHKSISKSDFENAPFMGLGVTKIRYLFDLNNLPCYLDVYKDCFEGLNILHIEFLKIKDADEFEIPEFLQNFIEKEITNTNRLHEENIALFGIENFTFDYESAFKRSMLCGGLRLEIPGFVSLYDGLRLGILGEFLLLEKNIFNYIHTRDKIILNNLIYNFKNISNFMSIFEFAFDKQIASIFLQKFSSILDELELLKQKIKLNEVTAYMYLNPEIADKNEENLKSFQNKVVNTLSQSDKLLRDFEAFLKDADGFYSTKDGLKYIKTALSYQLRLSILKTIKSLKTNEQSLENCLILHMMLDLFLNLFYQKSKIIKSLDKTIKRLETLHESYFLKNNLQNNQNFIMVLDKEIRKILKTNDKKIPNLLDSLHELSKILKIYYKKEICG